MASDPLLDLRAAILASSPITYSSEQGSVPTLAAATHLVLPSGSVPKNTPTGLLRPGLSEGYALEAVYLAWLLRDSAGAEYVKAAREAGLAVGFVSVTERKALVDWIEGRGPAPAGLPLAAAESTTPPGTPPARSSLLPSRASHAQSPSKRHYVADTADAVVVKKIKAAEIELRDRNTVLRGTKPNNFSSLRAVYAEKLKKLKEVTKPGAPAAVASAPSPDPKLLAKKQKNQSPIIIISSSPTALITMHNVKRFFEESVFELSQDARTRSAAEGNTKPEDMIPIYRKRTTIDTSGRETTTMARYHIVDSVEALSKFGADAWDRVVCVMTTGQAWQFRPYRWNEPRTLFHNVKGIYVAWANDPPNPKIVDWNVTPLKIDPNRRHVDKSVVAEFWKILDAWMLANKPWLFKT